MKEKTNFDISSLTLEELIMVYEDADLFLKYLEENKIEEDEDK